MIGSSKQAKHAVPGNITMLRLSDYIQNVVAKRSLLPSMSHQSKPSVVMKMDIEGSELEVLTDLLVTGSLQHIDVTMAEIHVNVNFNDNTERHRYLQLLQSSMSDLSRITMDMNLLSKINVISLDDESYRLSSFALPNCTKEAK